MSDALLRKLHRLAAGEDEIIWRDDAQAILDDLALAYDAPAPASPQAPQPGDER